ncbi:5-formyltetrahydrofolate cyclo-ligase [Caulobacter sp. LARHSG274]
MTIADPAAAKTALRLLVRNRRKELARQQPEAGKMAAERAAGPLSARFPEPAGKAASLYIGLGSEIDAAPLADWLAGQGWTLAAPSVEGEVGQMVFRRWTPGAPPDASHPVVEPDLVVVPLLAFDRDGRRLGQGGGYYDRALEALRARREVFVLGLAYSGQETHGLPREPHDQGLDAILTESEYIAVRKD